MIKRLMIIVCDKCKAEGPSVETENRPTLFKSALAEGWKMEGHRTICHECVIGPPPLSPISGTPPAKRFEK